MTPIIHDLRTLTTPNFAALAALTDAQLVIAERMYRFEAMEAEKRGRIGKRIGANQWLNAIDEEMRSRMVSQAVRAENARLRAYLEQLNAEHQGIPIPPQRKSEPTECSICRRVHGLEVSHPCE